MLSFAPMVPAEHRQVSDQSPIYPNFTPTTPQLPSLPLPVSRTMPPINTYDTVGPHAHMMPSPSQPVSYKTYQYCKPYHTRDELPMMDASQPKQNDFSAVRPVHLMTTMPTFVNPASGLPHQTPITISTGANDLQRPTNLPMTNTGTTSIHSISGLTTPLPYATPTPQTMSTSNQSPFTTPGRQSTDNTTQPIHDMTTPGPVQHDTQSTLNLTNSTPQSVSSPAGADSLSSSIRSSRSPSDTQRTRSTSRSSPTATTPGRSSSSGSKSSHSKREVTTAQPSRCLPKQAKVLLRDWLENNLEYPYPSDQEKQKLAKLASITALQVSYWFVNARRRLLPKLLAEANHQRSARGQPPIQIHPCARFSESFRPPHMKCDLTSPQQMIQIGSKGKDLASLKSPMSAAAMQHQLQQHNGMHIYEAPPLILSHPPQPQTTTTIIQHHPPAPVDGSDVSSDDDTSYVWSGVHGNKSTLYSDGLHQPSTVTMTTGLSSSMQANRFTSSSYTVSAATQGRIPNTSPSMAAAQGLAKMAPPPFVYSSYAEKPLDSHQQQISIQSPPFAQQHHQLYHPDSTRQHQQAKQGLKDDGTNLNGLSPPITPSVTSPENHHHHQQQQHHHQQQHSAHMTSPAPHFLFPVPAGHSATGVPTAFYASQNPTSTTPINQGPTGHIGTQFLGY